MDGEIEREMRQFEDCAERNVKDIVSRRRFTNVWARTRKLTRSLSQRRDKQ